MSGLLGNFRAMLGGVSQAQKTSGLPLDADMLNYVLTESQRLGISPEALISHINRTMNPMGIQKQHWDNPFLRSRVLGK